MPGKRITDHQVHKYKQYRNKLSQVACAAKAGISERSARRNEDAQSLPSQRPQRNWRTREDPLSTVGAAKPSPCCKPMPGSAPSPYSSASACGAPDLAASARSTLLRNTRQGDRAYRTSLCATTSALRLKAWPLPTACTNSHWHIADDETSRSSIRARASWPCPPDCRLHYGRRVACQKNTEPTACQRPSTTWQRCR